MRLPEYTIQKETNSKGDIRYSIYVDSYPGGHWCGTYLRLTDAKKHVEERKKEDLTSVWWAVDE